MQWKYCGVITILLGWFLRVTSLHACACFHSEKFLVTCCCCLVRFFFVVGVLLFKRKERWEGKPRGRCMVCEIQKYIEHCCSQRTNNCHKFKWNSFKLLHRIKNCCSWKLHARAQLCGVLTYMYIHFHLQQLEYLAIRILIVISRKHADTAAIIFFTVCFVQLLLEGGYYSRAVFICFRKPKDINLIRFVWVRSWQLLDAISSMHNLSVLLSVVCAAFQSCCE